MEMKTIAVSAVMLMMVVATPSAVADKNEIFGTCLTSYNGYDAGCISVLSSEHAQPLVVVPEDEVMGYLGIAHVKIDVDGHIVGFDVVSFGETSPCDVWNNLGMDCHADTSDPVGWGVEGSTGVACFVSGDVEFHVLRGDDPDPDYHVNNANVVVPC